VKIEAQTTSIISDFKRPIIGLKPNGPHISRLVRKPAYPILLPFDTKKSGAKVEKEMTAALNQSQHNPVNQIKFPMLNRLESNPAPSCFLFFP